MKKSFLTTFLNTCSEPFAPSYVLFSQISGTISLNGIPVTGARVSRTYHWDWGNTGAVDETLTDKQGNFTLPEITGRSISAWIPHQPNIDQRIEVFTEEREYEIWSGNKFSYESNSELTGKSNFLRFDLLGEPITHEHIVYRGPL